MQTTRVTCEPAILYFDTPVVLISTVNADAATNLAPMSSIFWLDWRCMLGFDARSTSTLRSIDYDGGENNRIVSDK